MQTSGSPHRIAPERCRVRLSLIHTSTHLHTQAHLAVTHVHFMHIRLYRCHQEVGAEQVADAKGEEGRIALWGGRVCTSVDGQQQPHCKCPHLYVCSEWAVIMPSWVLYTLVFVVWSYERCERPAMANACPHFHPAWLFTPLGNECVADSG